MNIRFTRFLAEQARSAENPAVLDRGEKMNPATDGVWLLIGGVVGVLLILAIMVIVILLGRSTGRDMVNGD